MISPLETQDVAFPSNSAIMAMPRINVTEPGPPRIVALTQQRVYDAIEYFSP